MDKNQEKEIVKKAQKDSEAFVVLFDKYYQHIFGYVAKRVANIALAQDITSETFFKALNKLGQFQWRGISFSSWLYKIATNEINAHYRSNRHTHISLEAILESQGLELADEQNLAEEVMLAEEKLSRHQEFLQAQKLISKLPSKYQDVISLKYFEQKKISEIAEILGKKEGTIKSLLSRGIGKLKEHMQPSSQSRIVDKAEADSRASRQEPNL